jgi:hypothetical protein
VPPLRSVKVCSQKVRQSLTTRPFILFNGRFDGFSLGPFSVVFRVGLIGEGLIGDCLVWLAWVRPLVVKVGSRRILPWEVWGVRAPWSLRTAVLGNHWYFHWNQCFQPSS